MIETLLRRFVEYRKRKQAVIILTALTLLVVVWPAADDYTAAGVRLRSARDDLDRAKQDVQALPQFTQVFVRKQDELRQLEARGVTATAAQSLRDDLVHLARQTGCMMRSIRLDEPSSRVWTDKDDPILGNRPAERGKETPFDLVTRRLSVSITGPMAGVHQFLSGIHRIEKLVHTQHISMKRSDTEENKTVLELDMVLFDLARRSET